MWRFLYPGVVSLIESSGSGDIVSDDSDLVCLHEGYVDGFTSCMNAGGGLPACHACRKSLCSVSVETA